MRAWQEQLLAELLTTYGPCGREDDVRAVCQRELEPLVDESWVDAAGNLVGLVRGEGAGEPVRVMAHLDELSMIVKRVEPTGDLHVQQLGVMNPGNYGLGPVAVLGDAEQLTGVLTLGSEHVTAETPQVFATQPQGGDQAMGWQHVRVFTGRTPQELADAGVHPGTRVCVHRSRRSLLDLGGFWGGYFLDDRAALVAVLTAARLLRESGRRPAGDAYLVLTTNEEVGGLGATHASGALPGDTTLALDVAPAEGEYATSVTSGPVVVYADDAGVYDVAVADRLRRLGTEIGVDPEAAVLASYDSDASQSQATGQAARAALLGLPTLSTHGYEVVHRDTVDRCARLLVEYLVRPV